MWTSSQMVGWISICLPPLLSYCLCGPYLTYQALHPPPLHSVCPPPPPDPVPAFKSWQDDSESGEAQLSPLAGRMVPLPLDEEVAEEDEEEAGQDASPSFSRSHPHLLARRFLDFGAHSTQRFLQQDPDATSPTKAQR